MAVANAKANVNCECGPVSVLINLEIWTSFLELKGGRMHDMHVCYRGSVPQLLLLPSNPSTEDTIDRKIQSSPNPYKRLKISFLRIFLLLMR